MPDQRGAGRRDALALHARYRGKLQTIPKCPIEGLDDFAVWYTPGVAEPCRAIAANPDAVDLYTARGNRIAVVSDGSRVLGLGNIGPAAGLPVMEGKALLFKYLGGVDAVPICLASRSPADLADHVRTLAPSFGAINLEDIAQPACFEVLDELRRTLSIPVWHDDQQGTAVVAAAALENALRVTERALRDCRIALIGVGAANVAVYRMLLAMGVDPSRIVACDSKGILHPGRRDIENARDRFPNKWRICGESNGEGRTGGVAGALRGADVCIAFATPGPGILDPAWIAGMAPKAIVFACANPVPEIWPEEARAAGAAVVATGRGDFPNQLNNALAFPGIFRGVLDIRARAITDGMTVVAAKALAAYAREGGLAPDRILPPLDDREVVVRVALAAAQAAADDGVAREGFEPGPFERGIRERLAATERTVRLLMREGVIAPLPLGEEAAS